MGNGNMLYKSYWLVKTVTIHRYLGTEAKLDICNEDLLRGCPLGFAIYSAPIFERAHDFIWLRAFLFLAGCHMLERILHKGIPLCHQKGSNASSVATVVDISKPRTRRSLQRITDSGNRREGKTSWHGRILSVMRVERFWLTTFGFTPRPEKVLLDVHG